MLNQTPPERLVDIAGRPYFLWDVDMTLDEFRKRLNDPDLEIRGYLVGKLMRQAKPDDVFAFVSMAEIVDLWPRLERTSATRGHSGRGCSRGGAPMDGGRLTPLQVIVLREATSPPTCERVSRRRASRSVSFRRRRPFADSTFAPRTKP